MKKLLYIIILFFLSINCYSQNPVQVKNPQWFLTWIKVQDSLRATQAFIQGTLQIPTDTSSNLFGSIAIKNHSVYFRDSSYWKQVGGDSNFYATRNWTTQNFVAIQTQSPTASLSGGYSYERHASGTFSVSLSWSAGRQAAGTGVNATNPLSSIVVAGTSQTFSQPSAGSSVSGSQSTGTMNYNTNYTFYNTVTTTDSKTAVASTSFGAYDKRYLGWSATTTPTSVEILAAVYQDNSGNNSSLTNTLAQLGSDKHLFFVTTSTVSSVSVNGFPSTAAFSLNNSVTFTNSSGGTFSGYYTVSNNAFGSTSTNTVIFN